MTKHCKKKLLDRVRDAIRAKHYSIRTEQAYVGWIKRYIFFHDKRHPLEMGATEIEEYLTYLAVDQNVAASTQNQALSALLFLYQNVLKKDLERPLDAVRAKKPQRLPTVLTRKEVQQVRAAMSGTQQLIARLLYGSGLRLIEGLRLRVKDVDFAQHQIIVRQDLAKGYGAVYLPDALERKYPNANQEWMWQYIFPAKGLSTDPRPGVTRRRHLHESTVRRAVRDAAKLTGINKHVTPHTSLCGHCFATHLPRLRSSASVRSRARTSTWPWTSRTISGATGPRYYLTDTLSE